MNLVERIWKRAERAELAELAERAEQMQEWVEREREWSQESRMVLRGDDGQGTPPSSPDGASLEAAATKNSLLGPLRAVALMVPHALCDEKIGDALEAVEQLDQIEAPRWQKRLKIWSAVFWVLVSAAREVMSAVLGKSTTKK